jgi:chemotaxis protein CheX
VIAAMNEATSTFPAVIADAVRAAVTKTFSAICGEAPKTHAIDAHIANGDCIAAIIAFIGETPWSYTLVLTSETAPALAKQYFGIEVPFDSSDMGDVAGELANVLAGDVVAQLEQRGMHAQMSLPTVARGNHLEFMPEKAAGLVRLDYLSKQGPFWLRLMAVTSKFHAIRLPGV